MTREEAETRCRLFAHERGWEFMSRDHYPLIASEDENDPEPVYADEPDGFEFEFYNPAADTMSTVKLPEHTHSALHVTLDSWLSVLSRGRT